jgi:glycosyltransferase involved in cell wall biosynthesis
VSIVVPSFNQGRFIKDTIQSILSQDYRPLEIHVIDGGSTDETIEVLRSFNSVSELNWVSEKDSGVVEAVNKGFKKVSGRIVGIQSSDDTYLPQAISSAVAQLQTHPQCGLVYADTIKIDATGNEISKYVIGPYSLENILLLKSWIPQPSAFFRAEMLEACGPWNNEVQYAADTDLWLRMMFRTEVRKIDQYWSQRRIHDAQRDTQIARIANDYGKMLDISPDISNASAEVKRWAQASKHLMQVRYCAKGSSWSKAMHLWKAKRLASQSVTWQRIFGECMLPCRILLSKVKRNLIRR